jgi:hypothetical protein
MTCNKGRHNQAIVEPVLDKCQMRKRGPKWPNCTVAIDTNKIELPTLGTSALSHASVEIMFAAGAALAAAVMGDQGH